MKRSDPAKLPSQAVGHGVDELIDRLREEGVLAGRLGADAIKAQAQMEAEVMIETAQRAAEAIGRAAEEEAARLRRNVENSLRTAMSQVVLELRGQLLERFSVDIRRLVSDALDDAALIDRLIVEVAGAARDAAGVRHGEPIEVLLPVQSDEHDLRQDLDALRASPLTQLVISRTSRILSQGVTLASRSGAGEGLLLRLRDGDVEIDLSANAVAQVLLDHLQPRFRSIFDGVIR